MGIDSTSVIIAVGIVAGLFALYFLGAPMLVRMVFRKPIEPGLAQISTDQTLIPPEAMATFQATQPPLEKLGFVQETYLRLDPLADLMDAYAVVLVHPANRDLVMILHCLAPVPLMQVEFSTEFENGNEINTNNGPTLPLGVVSKAGKVVYWYPETSDPAELYRAHTALCAAQTGSRKKSPPHGVDLVNNIRQSMHDDFQHAVQRGVFTVDDSDAYTLTIGGAYRLAWPNMFPINHYCKARKISRDRRALQRATGR